MGAPCVSAPAVHKWVSPGVVVYCTDAER